MKVVKKTILVFIVLFVLIIGASALIPIFFKENIKAAIEQEVAQSINAEIQFDVDDINLTLFKNFPNLTAETKALSVFNRAPFDGMLLFAMDRFDVELNLADLIFGEQVKLKGITLLRPRINIKVLQDGRANYDITYPSSDTLQVDDQSSDSFSFGIDHWEIIDGNISYDDLSLPFHLDMKNINHTGRGSFTEKEFDLAINTSLDTLSVVFDGVEYISNKRLEAEMILGVSEEYTRFTFKENKISLNAFGLAFDGWFELNDKDYDMDITYQSAESTFKSLLSLVPGIYTQDFTDLEADGNIAFAGFIKGTYNEKRLPAFNLQVKVNEGTVHYPTLPTSIEHVNMDLTVDNQDGIVENTRIDLSKLHLDFGDNPVDLNMVVENLKNYKMDGNLKAQINLEDINKIVPLEGLEMKGTFSMTARVKGIYDSIKKIIPTLDVATFLHNGYVKSKDFPLPLENMECDATIKNTSGKMSETIVHVKKIGMVMDGEELTADLTLQNLDDYTWNLNASGGVDLEKITKIFPIDGMSLAGKIKANLHTKGKMSDVDAKRYDRFPTYGRASINDFAFTYTDLSYPPVKVKESQITFDPKKIELKNTYGTIGKSDFNTEGYVRNYIAYLFTPNETIRGSLDFKSTFLDLNEFMTETEGESATDTVSYSVIPIPKNIDFVMKSSIGKVNVMDYTLTRVLGSVFIKDGVATLKDMGFDMLGGAFQLAGVYNPTKEERPEYNMQIGIQHMDIEQASKSFSIVNTYAPIAGIAKGKFNTDLKMKGALLASMTPDMATVDADGYVRINRAGLKESEILSITTKLIKALPNTEEITLKDAYIPLKIKKGRLIVDPFDATLGGYKTTVQGSNGIDGSIDYIMTMKVPSDKLGGQAQEMFNTYLGGDNMMSEIPISVGVKGTYKNPKVTLRMEEQKKILKQLAAKALKKKGEQVIQNALQGTEANKIIEDLFKKPDQSNPNEENSEEKETPLEKVLQEGIQNLFKKKK